jgi:hypothetical protein
VDRGKIFQRPAIPSDGALEGTNACGLHPLNVTFPSPSENRRISGREDG